MLRNSAVGAEKGTSQDRLKKEGALWYKNKYYITYIFNINICIVK